MNVKKPVTIQDPYVYTILKEIHTRGAVHTSQLSNIASWRTIDRRLRFMMDNGLLSYTVKEKGRRVNLYSLTDKGYDLFLLLNMSENIINGTMDLTSGRMTERIEELTVDTPTESLLRKNSTSPEVARSRMRKNQ